jgi:hypothetical protein
MSSYVVASVADITIAPFARNIQKTAVLSVIVDWRSIRAEEHVGIRKLPEHAYAVAIYTSLLGNAVTGF